MVRKAMRTLLFIGGFALLAACQSNGMTSRFEGTLPINGNLVFSNPI